MRFEIILPIVAISLLLFVFLVNIPRVTHLRDMAGHRFICPNCGERFRVKWYRLLLSRWRVELTDKAPLTCPVCKACDLCKRESTIYTVGDRV